MIALLQTQQEPQQAVPAISLEEGGAEAKTSFASLLHSFDETPEAASLLKKTPQNLQLLKQENIEPSNEASLKSLITTKGAKEPNLKQEQLPQSVEKLVVLAKKVGVLAQNSEPLRQKSEQAAQKNEPAPQKQPQHAATKENQSLEVLLKTKETPKELKTPQHSQEPKLQQTQNQLEKELQTLTTTLKEAIVKKEPNLKQEQLPQSVEKLVVLAKNVGVLAQNSEPIRQNSEVAPKKDEPVSQKQPQKQPQHAATKENQSLELLLKTKETPKERKTPQHSQEPKLQQTQNQLEKELQTLTTTLKEAIVKKEPNLKQEQLPQSVEKLVVLAKKVGVIVQNSEPVLQKQPKKQAQHAVTNEKQSLEVRLQVKETPTESKTIPQDHVQRESQHATLNSDEQTLANLLHKVEEKEQTPYQEPKSQPQPTALTTMLHDAKVYLKELITKQQHHSTQTAQAQELPKSLKGLMEYAKKIGIDVEKIRMETFTKVGVQQRAQGHLENLKSPTTPMQNFSDFAVKSTTTASQPFVQQVHTKELEKKGARTQKASLETLLNVHNVEKKEPQLTADFSRASATVVPPKMMPKETVGEEETQDDVALVQKTQNLEVKIHEAKQMVKYLSHDVKTAIENYKAPFTRIKVQLHPQQLGDVELTVVQRGKNLHIQLSSNNTAINTLALHANDLKGQLQHNGIQNASLHFNNTTQGESSNANTQQQQQHQQQQQARDEYKAFEIDAEKEELLSSLEIVVPNYA